MVGVNQDEADAVMAVVIAETNAFWMKDYEAWADCWVQTPYIRRMGWWARGGISITEGWDTLSGHVRQVMDENPTPQPRAAQVRRERVNVRTSEHMAWVTFEQYGADTGEPDMDMPGLSHESRVLEKHDGQWKLAYIGWLLEGE